MPQYKSYPDVKTQPNRTQRKAARKTTFEYNHTVARKARRAKRDERKSSAKGN